MLWLNIAAVEFKCSFVSTLHFQHSSGRMNYGISSQAPLRSIGLLDRISAARAGGDIGHTSIVAGPGCARARKDVSRRGSLASPQGKKLRLSGASAICDDSDADEEQSLPEGRRLRGV